MTSPGTAVVTLPVYSVPVFTNATVKLGAAITSVTFEGTPSVFTFGQPFKIGEVAPTDGLVGRLKNIPDINLQMDVKARHSDGSVRHAIISGVLPTGATGEMFLIRAVKKLSTTTPLAPTSYSARVAISDGTGEYITSGAAKSSFVWLTGEAVKETVSFCPLMNTEGIEHPFLVVQLCERVYSTGQVKVDITVEHARAYVASTDIVYDVQMLVGGVEVYSKDALVHFPRTRYKKTFWHGVKPDLHCKHNTPYLIATKAVANYDQSVVVTEAALANYATALTKYSFEPMAVGRFQAAMGTTGGRPDLGLAPDSYAAYILSGDKRAKAIMLLSGDVGGSWAGHARNDDYTQLDIVHYPRATILGNLGDTLNPLTKQYEKLPLLTTVSKNLDESAHQPGFAYVPYLLTGDYFYLEELQFWCNYNGYVSNPYYRLYEKGVVKSDQVRGQGWSIRTMAQAAYITPDTHYNKMVFQYILDSNMEWYRTTYTDGTDNVLGVLTHGMAIGYPVKGVAKVGVAPWMDDFFTQGVGCAAELGNAEAVRLLKWKAKFQIGRMIDPGYCPKDAAIYQLRVRDTETSPFYTTLKQCREGSLEPAEYACDLNADYVGYPTNTEGFPANYQPALAACIDTGAEGGDKAWNTFMARKLKPNYGNSPQFAVVPRKTIPIVIVTPPETVPPVIPPVIPPVVVPPVVEIAVTITNSILANQTGLTVILVNDLKTKVWLNQSANAAGTIKIVDSALVPGTLYDCKVINSQGYTVTTIYPIKAV
ncbi:TPA: hypothetical protein NOB78_002933 [Enterococcus faecium]|nr:hypothetical protein [Enterococcus faecium]